MSAVGPCRSRPGVSKAGVGATKIEGFKDIVQQNWSQEIVAIDNAKRLTAKFKRLRKRLKEWAKGIYHNSVVLSEQQMRSFYSLILLRNSDLSQM